jgi:hypothetical protein
MSKARKRGRASWAKLKADPVRFAAWEEKMAAGIKRHLEEHLGAVPVLAEPQEKGISKDLRPSNGGEARESTSTGDAVNSTSKPELGRPVLPSVQDSRGGVQTSSVGNTRYACVRKLYYNPRMVLASFGLETDGGNPADFVEGGIEVVVGDNAKFWIGCPILVEPSSDYRGYWQLVGAAPRYKGDRAYLERF